MTVLTGPLIALILVLALYATGHLIAVLAYLVRRRTTPVPDPPADGVAVLIPARNEGAAAVRALKSVLHQAHAGRVEAYLLIKDLNDSAIEFLQAAWPTADFTAPVDGLVDLVHTPERRLAVALVGADPKHTKVNWMVARLGDPVRWTAILDCDHQAHPDWLHSALATLHAHDARAVQCRRLPIDARGLFSYWDALHQHVGCELLNGAFTRLGLNVFLTGTTLVVDTNLMRAHPLRDCLTEDTDLSYRLFLSGERIVADPAGGSDEEVSPDLHSFFARRRRWANGHTEAFLRHLPKLRTAPITRRARVQFVFHGLHYLMAAGVFMAHLLLGILYAGRLPLSLLGITLAASVLLGGWAASTQRARQRATFLTDVAVLSAWLWPATVVGATALMAGLFDASALALPLPHWVLTLGLVSLCMPVVVQIVGLAGSRRLTWSTLGYTIITWPVAFYLDLSGILIGLVDGLFDRRRWFVVHRRATGLEDDLDRTMGIIDSVRPTRLGRAFLKGVWMTISRPALWLRFGVPLLLLAGLWGAARWTRVPVVRADCQPMHHDTDPWIVHPDVLGGKGYCDVVDKQPAAQWTRPTSRYAMARHDGFKTVDPAVWDHLNDTFECNLAHFRPRNVEQTADGLTMHLRAEQDGDRAYTTGSIATKTDAKYRYGRFEAVLKPARGSGIISAFFLYRFDPWQEIDFEFLGRDTTKALLNVYYNPGAPGATYNYGLRGTPVLVDLGFDAAEDFHTYAIEWDVDEIRWYADGRLIHRRADGRPTPIPHLPMRLHLNLWPICSEELAGPLDTSALPAQAQFKSMTVYAREDAWYQRLLSWFDPPPRRVDVWQDQAAWIRGQAAPR
jgi:beta-glucanase (GH16 family)/cellulose synthase/poly-beta-1,6-N-acetylglucosamine synthase-like glycosyltransferase